jgi:hypothetical protein
MKATPRHRHLLAALAFGLVTTTAGVAHAEHVPWLGAIADVGVPDGGTAGVVLRPVPFARMHAGVSHNLVSKGLRGGITIAPLKWTVSPTVTFEYGHYFEGDANPVIRMISGDDEFSSPLLERVGYDYANGHLGLEFGRKWFSFYLHAGVSRVYSTVHGLDAALEGAGDDGSGPAITLNQDPGIAMWTVSAKLGFVFYFIK